MPTPREPFPGSIQYTVRKGDSLYRISRAHGIDIRSLKMVNGLSSNMIHEGMVLNLPGDTSVVLSRWAVGEGETLCAVSVRCNVPVEDLMRENGLTSDVVAAGQELLVPLIRQRPLQEILVERGACCPSAKPCLVVDKSQHTLMLFVSGIWLKTYHADLGGGGAGDWEFPGDGKTPEGTYSVCQTSVAASGERLPNSSSLRPGSGVPSGDRPAGPGESQCVGTGVVPQAAEAPLVSDGNSPRSASRRPGSVRLDLSYPNIKDAYRGIQRGLIDWETYDSISVAINNGKMPPQDTLLGGGIGIIGGSRSDLGSDWTHGSIALTDNDMGEVYEFVKGAATRDALVQCSILGAGRP